jgi:uncharacterized protein
MKFTDRANIGQVKRTEEGYIATQARALRTGVQEYAAWEFGDMAISDGFDRDDIIRVYRPPESVFSKDSLKTAVHIPVTVDHPDEMVSSANYADLAVGEVSTDVMRDGEFVAFSIMVKDKRGIEAIDAGKVELSAGYTAELVRVAHTDYDYVMGRPHYNHLAIVDKARAGEEARIGDNAAKQWGAAPLSKPDKKETVMDIVKVMIGDKAVSVAAADADIVTKLMQDLEAEKASHAATKVEAADAARQIKTPEDIAQMVADGVKEIAEVSAKASKLVKDYDATGKSAMEIRRDVIQKVYGDEAIADLQSDAEIKAAFAVARVEETPDPVRAAAADAKMKRGEEKGNAWDGMYKSKKKDEKK